jgi:hypothetical protein
METHRDTVCQGALVCITLNRLAFSLASHLKCDCILSKVIYTTLLSRYARFACPCKKVRSGLTLMTNKCRLRLTNLRYTRLDPLMEIAVFDRRTGPQAGRSHGQESSVTVARRQTRLRPEREREFWALAPRPASSFERSPLTRNTRNIHVLMFVLAVIQVNMMVEYVCHSGRH